MDHTCAKLPTLVCQGGQDKVPSGAKLPIARCNFMPSYPSQAIACHVAHRKVPLPAKLPIVRCLHVPHLTVPLDAYVTPRKVLSCGMLPITRCHRVQNLSCQGAIVWLRCPLCGALGGYRMEPSCAYVPYVKVPSFAYVPHVKVPSCAFVAHRMCPLLCSKLYIAWGALCVPREVIP